MTPITTITAYDETAVSNALNEFISISDDNADSWLTYLLEGWMSSDAVTHTDADMRAKMMRNFNSIVDLVRTVQESHRYHYALDKSE